MKALVTLKRLLVAALEWLLILAVAVLVLDVLWGVVSRYLLGGQSVWTEELARNLIIWVALLGTSVAFATKGHLGVDYFVGKLHPDAQRFMAIVGNLLVALFAALVMIKGGMTFVSDRLASGQITPAMGLPTAYVYLAVPLSGVFLVLFALEAVVETVVHGAPPQTDEEA